MTSIKITLSYYSLVLPVIPDKEISIHPVSSEEINITWTPPPSLLLLTGYEISRSMIPAIKTSDNVKSTKNKQTVPANSTSASIQTCSYCNVAVSVAAVYKGAHTAPLYTPTTIQTAQSCTYNTKLACLCVKQIGPGFDPPLTAKLFF